MRNTNMYEDRDCNCKSPRCSCHKKGGSFAEGLVWGTLVGGVLGILFAPDKGDETRKKIKKTAKEYEEKGKETFENWKKINNSEYNGIGFTMKNNDTLSKEEMKILKETIEGLDI